RAPPRAGGSACAAPRRPASVVPVVVGGVVARGGAVARLELQGHAAAVAAAAALHLAGAHVVDDALAGDAAAPGLLHHRAADEHHRVLAQVVVDPRRGRVHHPAVVHFLAQPHRRAGEPGALDVAVALADVGARGVDHQRALDDVDVAGEHAGPRVGDRAVAAVGLHAHGLLAVGRLGHG